MIQNREIKSEIFQQIKVFFADVDGTLTDACVYYSANGEEMKKFNHRDGRGNYLLRCKGIKFGMITGEDSQIVIRRSEKLKSDYCFVGVDDKYSFIKNFCIKEKISLKEVAYIGDDTNDLEIMQHIGLAFAVNDAFQDVKDTAHFICSKRGGDGAFREAVDHFLSELNK